MCKAWARVRREKIDAKLLIAVSEKEKHSGQKPSDTWKLRKTCDLYCNEAVKNCNRQREINEKVNSVLAKKSNKKIINYRLKIKMILRSK